MPRNPVNLERNHFRPFIYVYMERPAYRRRGRQPARPNPGRR